MTLLVLAVAFALVVSHLCSLLEAALLSARLPALAGQAEAGSRGAARLLEIKQRRLDDAISAILILNTVANTLGATFAGAQAGLVFGSAWVGVFSGVLTLAILVLSEIVPKTLGAVYAVPLSGFVGTALHFLTLLMTPALVVSRVLTRVLARRAPEPFSRGELAALLASAAKEGALSGIETRLVKNVLELHEISLREVLTPRPVLFMMEAAATVADLLAEAEAPAFSRIPLYGRDREDVVGYVLQREVLRAATEGGDRSRRLDSWRRPIAFLPESLPVGRALEGFLKGHEAIAMVVDELGSLAGLVSLEDLTETLLGAEIVDESDRVADLRRTAAERREDRLERLRRKRAAALQPPPG